MSTKIKQKETVNFKKNKSNCIWEKNGVFMKAPENWRVYDHPKVEATTHHRQLLPCKKAVPMLLALTNIREKLDIQIIEGNISIPKY